ncbi:MAG: hypothetical protein MJE77_18380 [Proteobacteria bacterium]|nr:hypothetical protein [Pseudomonadota bacterium]
MRTRRTPGRQISDNPFYVLGLSPDCSRAEVEREGQKLLGMLELGLSAARTYKTPLGLQIRTAEKVRDAMAQLRDPDRRLGHELWARRQPEPTVTPKDLINPPNQPEDNREDGGRGWADARSVLGWRRR